jgi:hypothetical protein
MPARGARGRDFSNCGASGSHAVVSTSLEGAASLARWSISSLLSRSSAVGRPARRRPGRYYQEETFEEVISIDPEMVERKSPRLQENEPEKPKSRTRLRPAKKSLATPLESYSAGAPDSENQAQEAQRRKCRQSEETLDLKFRFSVWRARKTKAVLNHSPGDRCPSAVALPLYEAIGGSREAWNSREKRN